MPTTKKTITEIARDFAEGNELTAAMKARAPAAPTQDESREPWVRRWLDLSDWARARELRELDRDLAETLEELRLASEVAEEKAAEAVNLGSQMEGFFHYVVECHDPHGTSEITQRLAETKVARDNAMEAVRIAADTRRDYAEAKGVVAVARIRSQDAHRHFSEMRRVRVRAVTVTFLLTLVVLVTAAMLLHYRMHARWSGGSTPAQDYSTWRTEVPSPFDWSRRDTAS